MCRKAPGVRIPPHPFASQYENRPTLPETAFNRLADNWRPLFAIAEAAGVTGRGAVPRRLPNSRATMIWTRMVSARSYWPTLPKFSTKRAQIDCRRPSLLNDWQRLNGGPGPNGEGNGNRFRLTNLPTSCADLESPRAGSALVAKRLGATWWRIFERLSRGICLRPPFQSATVQQRWVKRLLPKVQHPDGVLHPENARTRGNVAVLHPVHEKPDLDAINREFVFAAEADAKHAAPVVLAAEDDSELIL